MGIAPKLIAFELVCTTNDAGFVVGDVVEVSVVVNSQASTSRANGVYKDATNVYVRFGNTSTPFVVGNKTTGVATVLVNGSWDLIVRAFA